MKLTLRLPHNNALSTIFQNNQHLSVESQTLVDVITCTVDDENLKQESVDDIVKRLTALLDVLVSEFVRFIKLKDLDAFLEQTTQLRSIVSYCSDLSRVLESNADDTHPSKLLALIKVKNIENKYTIFPSIENDPSSQLNYNDALWFTGQYEGFSQIKNNEIKEIQSQANDDELPLSKTAQIFLETYQLMTEFITLEKCRYLSQAASAMTLQIYTYENFAKIAQGKEALQDRLLHRQLILEINELSSTQATPELRLIRLTNIYEIIKDIPENDYEQYAHALNFLTQFELDTLKKIIIEIKSSLPPPADHQDLILCKDYLAELSKALHFCEALQTPKNSPTATGAEKPSVVTQITAAIDENIKSLENLNKALLSYHTKGLTHSTTRAQFSNDLIGVATNSQVSVRQRVMCIQKKIANNPEAIEKSRTDLLEKCWNILKRIGNAAKSIYHYRNKIDREAYFEKAIHPETSIGKKRVSSRLFQAVKAVGADAPVNDLVHVNSVTHLQ